MSRSNFKPSWLTLCVGLALASQAHSAVNGQNEAIARLTAANGSGAQIAINPATGAARFVRLAPTAKGSQAAARSGSSDAVRQTRAVQFLNEYSGLFGIKNASAELAVGQVFKDRQGGTHLTHKQMYRGVPVFGAELKSHFDAADSLVAVNGNFVPDIAVNPVPSRSAAEAAAKALARVKADLGSKLKSVSAISVNTPTLMIYREGLAKGVEGANHLAWEVQVGNRVDVREFVYVDAHSGKVIDKISGIHEAKNRRAFNAAGATAPGADYPNNPFWVEGQAFPTGTTEADNMIAASSEIYDLFKTAFGRDSYDGAGARMDSIFNRGNACPNASWNGTFISFCPGLTTDDVTAHEWAHAYTEYTHGLIYAWQPGALNEAYSDIWGETVDRLNGRGTDTPDAQRTADACTASTNTTQVNITAPLAIAGVKATGTAAFGPQLFNLGTTDVVVVNDGSGTTTDGCDVPFVNAAALVGKIAYMDRGSCGFGVKAKNAELAGAVGVIIGNNAAGIINMAAAAGVTNLIPALSVQQVDGTAIKAATGVKAALQRGPGSDNSVRWLLGEDSTAVGLTGALRDMYNPTCYGNPGKVTDVQYSCGPNTQAGDSGGVHSNSGVPNHAYALLVDGGTYNGQNVSAIGLTKAAHIYYRAQTVYQGPASGFADHADAIEHSCADLTGVNLADLKTGLPSGEVLSASDCAQVAKATLAVQMRTEPTQCNFTSLLQKSPPPLCDAGTATSLLASDNFEGGKRGSLAWLVSHQGEASGFTPRNFAIATNLPGSKGGKSMYAADIDAGNCNDAAGSQAGVQRLDSPEITVPAGAAATRMSFAHWVSTEQGWDGGNVKISVNGGAWQLVKAADFLYNPYNLTLNTAAAGNDNPLAGQPAFSGGDGGSVGGSWGRSMINLAPYAVAGDKIKLRFELGNDCAGGALGWYIDDVQVYRCTP
jgi:bacillolysin